MFHQDEHNRTHTSSENSYLVIAAIIAMAASFLLAFFGWTLPNIHWFSQFTLQTPLWRLSLIITIISPVIVVIAIGLGFWLFFLLRSYKRGDFLALEQEEASDRFFTSQSSPSVVPPLFTLPTTPFPSSTPVAKQREQQRERRDEQRQQTRSEERKITSRATQLHLQRRQKLYAKHAALSPQTRPSQSDAPVTPIPAANGISPLMETAPSSVSPIRIDLTLLKTITVTLHAPGGVHQAVSIRPGNYGKRLQLLAYLGYRRGGQVELDKLREQVFGHGLPDEEATTEQLGNAFESAKREIRRNLREEAEKINEKAGQTLVPLDIDIFSNDSGLWRISDLCQVVDIQKIVEHYAIIEKARQEGRLTSSVPEQVKDACEVIIQTYTGDFLDDIIKKYPSEFRSSHGMISWIRQPYTMYRDYWFDALWWAAEYWNEQGKQLMTEQPTPETEQQQREYLGRAAQLYWTHARSACNRFDLKVSFNGKPSERVSMAERAFRRAVVCYGALGRTDYVDQLQASFFTLMNKVSDQHWKPEEGTLKDLEAAKAQTSAYRFSSSPAKSEAVEMQKPA